MKKLVAILFFLTGLSLAVQAQNFTKDDVLTPISLNSSLTNFETLSFQNTSFKVEMSKILPSQNTFLFSSLGLFEGIKFHSVLDQFESIPMFDSRAYKPTSVSDYNNYLHRNYLILHSSFPKVW